MSEQDNMEFSQDEKMMLTSELFEVKAELERLKEEISNKDFYFNSIISSLYDFVFELDEQHRFVNFWTQDISQLYLSPDVFLGKSFEIIFDKIISNKLKFNIKKTLETGKPSSFEYELLINNKTEFFQAEVCSIKINHINSIHFLIKTKNITYYKLSEIENKEIKLDNLIKDLALEKAIVPIGLATLDAKVIFVNDSFLEKWGYGSKEEVNGRFIGEFAHSDIFIEKVLESIRTKGYYHGIGRPLKKDGTYFDAEFSMTIIKDENNRPICMMASFIDISDINRTRLELENTNLKFKNLFNNLNTGILILSKIEDKQDFIISELNKAALSLSGISYENLINSSFSLFCNLSKTYHLIKIANEVFETEIPQIIQSDLEDSGENVKLIEHFLFKLPSNEIVVVCNDYTERFLSNKKLLKANKRLESLQKISEYKANSVKELLKYALDEIINLTESKIGVILKFNDIDYNFSIEALSVLAEDDSINLVFPPMLKYRQDGFWSNILKTKTVVTINNFQEFEKVNQVNFPFGHFNIEKVLVVPIYDDNELVTMIALANKEADYDKNDSLQTKLMIDSVYRLLNKQVYQEKLFTAKTKIEQYENLKRAFLANMSHEIRTPLNGILGFAQLLSKGDLEEDERDEYSKVMMQSGNRLIQIVDNILDIAKIETGQTELYFKNCDIHSLLEELLYNYEQISKLKNLELSVTIDKESPIQTIVTDEIKLRQILSHLLDNAIKFTNKGFVKFGYDTFKKSIRFYVIDSGIGIPKEYQKDIFDRFTQLDLRLAREYEGAGLGLAISKGFVELMGGDIWVESDGTTGSTFYITLPLDIDENGFVSKFNELNSVLNRRKTKMEILNEKNITLLIAEDDEVNYFVIEKLFRKTTFKLIRARNGKEAVEIFKSHPEINMVLMDLKMPIMDGFEATILIKGINKNIPVIAITAFAMIDEKKLAFASGCDEYLSKPVNIDEVMETINKHLK